LRLGIEEAPTAGKLESFEEYLLGGGGEVKQILKKREILGTARCMGFSSPHS